MINSTHRFVLVRVPCFFPEQTIRSTFELLIQRTWCSHAFNDCIYNVNRITHLYHTKKISVSKKRKHIPLKYHENFTNTDTFHRKIYRNQYQSYCHDVSPFYAFLQISRMIFKLLLSRHFLLFSNS